MSLLTAHSYKRRVKNKDDDEQIRENIAVDLF
jgi:hypothetical protein